MNKQQRQELEDMVRQLAEEPYNPSEKHIEEIKQRAFEEYEQIMAAKQKMKEKRKGTLRRVVVTAAAIVCLLVGSTVIALLNPLQSGNADNFFRRAVIWVNDQLHLGIQLPLPKNEETKAQFAEGDIMPSILDVAETVDFPIVYLEETQDLHFDLITKEIEPFSNEIAVNMKYSAPDGIIRITESNSDSNFTSINLSESIAVQTAVGSIDIYETAAFNTGILVIENAYVTIVGTMPVESFLSYCQHLHVLN